MKARQLEKLGIPPGKLAKAAKWLARQAEEDGMARTEVRKVLSEIAADPGKHVAHPHFGELAKAVLAHRQTGVIPAGEVVGATGGAAGFVPRSTPAPWRMWAISPTEIDRAAVQQIENACRLPVSVRGALMPDAHVGYGLPIGGVLGVENAVIPYGVGVDIACRMKITVLDLPADALARQADWLADAIEKETRFGVGAEFKERGGERRREHSVMDADWSVSPITKANKDKAWAQLGTSGSGNHFVEFGTLAPGSADHAAALGLPEVRPYLALLSHSGSRGTGAQVASHYSKLAMQVHPDLPKELRFLAWLGLDTAEGQEYWAAMQLMGQYAAANHACIHRAIAKHLGARVLLDLENHHNFAWEEEHPAPDGARRRMIVHRKGATPAGPGVLGIIPGSMAAPAYIVRGRGQPESLESAAHGAGRVMSRTAARHKYRWNAVRPLLEQRGVRVLSAGIDEVPYVYKNIDEVMAAQADLVEPLAKFEPRIVKMAPEGEQAED